ncbi:MAG: LysR substrate-binding domain-containing protein [Hyphomicrobiales bacterium]|nr:LysR substrate-binding domain-containing protein [Hyphomicrobiales bacterium]
MHLKELDANLVVVLDALLIDASVTKAAERLGRSPSAISHALANLREVFDDELFVRAGQRLAPTAKALAIAPTIHVIVTGIESLLRPAAPFDAATQERAFSVLCRETSEFTLLQPLRTRLKTAAPGVMVTGSALEPESWMEKLRLGQAQFAVVEAMAEEGSGEFHWRALFEDEWSTIAPKSHPLAAKKADGHAFASERHIVIAPPPKLHDPLKATLAANALAAAEVTWASSLFSGVFLALETNAPVTLPDSVAKAVMKHLPLKPVRHDLRTLRNSVYLVWHRSNDRDECHAWLRGEIAACAPQ